MPILSCRYGPQERDFDALIVLDILAQTAETKKSGARRTSRFHVVSIVPRLRYQIYRPPGQCLECFHPGCSNSGRMKQRRAERVNTQNCERWNMAEARGMRRSAERRYAIDGASPGEGTPLTRVENW